MPATITITEAFAVADINVSMRSTDPAAYHIPIRAGSVPQLLCAKRVYRELKYMRASAKATVRGSLE